MQREGSLQPRHLSSVILSGGIGRLYLADKLRGLNTSNNLSLYGTSSQASIIHFKFPQALSQKSCIIAEYLDQEVDRFSSRSHLKILGARRVRWSKIHAEKPQILVTTVHIEAPGRPGARDLFTPELGCSTPSLSKPSVHLRISQAVPPLHHPSPLYIQELARLFHPFIIQALCTSQNFYLVCHRR